jgi:predicted O-methyltransferase YrrM
MRMTAIRGYMTVGCLEGYRPILDELIDALMSSRLYEKSESIELAVLGRAEDQAAVDALIRPFERMRVVYRSGDLSDYEFPALGLLQEACRSWSGVVYYLHTKGVSRPSNPFTASWRRLMLDTVVVGHGECLDALEHHDAVGTNWRGNHYSGNFWWATSEHIRRLPPIQSLRSTPRTVYGDPVLDLRLQCEFWIGMSPGRFANLGPRDLDLYRTIRWRHDAAEVINVLLASTGGGRYLEVVSGSPSPYLGAVSAPVRDVVSVSPWERVADVVSPETRDGAPYDVILVDSWHEAGHCLDMIEWSLDRLAPFGAIVVHDTNPPSAWHQRPPGEFQPGSDWNGEAWQAVVRFRQRHPEMDVRTVETDWGCTVIRPDAAAGEPLDADVGPLTWELLQRDRARLLNLVSIERLRRDVAWTRLATGIEPLTSRTQVLNALVSYLGLERYLEVGVGNRQNFEAIIAPVRQGVDPVGQPTFAMTSDEFFERGLGCAQYDLVFIDALHEAEACLRDIEHALDRLAPAGWIVLHDTNPPTEWHQRPASEFTEGEDWNGDVWKAVVRLREQQPDLGVVTLDLDFGCTLISRRLLARPLNVCPETLDWETFAGNRHQLLALVPGTWAEVDRILAGIVLARREHAPAMATNAPGTSKR